MSQYTQGFLTGLAVATVVTNAVWSLFARERTPEPPSPFALAPCFGRWIETCQNCGWFVSFPMLPGTDLLKCKPVTVQCSHCGSDIIIDPAGVLKLADSYASDAKSHD